MSQPRPPGRPPRRFTSPTQPALMAEMERAGVTQADVCRITGSSPATINAAAHGNGPPPPPERVALLHGQARPGRPGMDCRPIAAQRALSLHVAEIPIIPGDRHLAQISPIALELQGAALVPSEARHHLLRVAALAVRIVASDLSLPSRTQPPARTDYAAAMADLIEHVCAVATGTTAEPCPDSTMTIEIAERLAGLLPDNTARLVTP